MEGFVNPDFAAYAKNCGAFGIKVTEKSQLDAAFKQLMEQEGPGLLEIKTDVKLI